MIESPARAFPCTVAYQKKKLSMYTLTITATAITNHIF